MLLATAPTKPKEPVRKLITKPTIPIIIWNRKSTPKVFSHRQLTSSRLRDKLSNALMFSIMITGTTRENIIAKIIPGIINAISPSTMRIPVITLTAKRDSSRDSVKLKLDRRAACLSSSVSEANFTAIP